MSKLSNHIYGGSGEERTCPACHGLGKIFNNGDKTSNQFVDCDFCHSTGIVNHSKWMSYYQAFQDELVKMIKDQKNA